MMKPCAKCGSVNRSASGVCRACKKIYDIKYQIEHAERIKRTKAKYYEVNSEKIKTAIKKYRDENPQTIKERKAKYLRDNREKEKIRIAKWKKANPEKTTAKVRVANHKRRALKNLAGGCFTPDDIKSMLKNQHKKCIACGCNISKKYHVDHIMPLSLGGHNGIGNIQLLCPHCNFSKNSKHPIDFMQSRGFLL